VRGYVWVISRLSYHYVYGVASGLSLGYVWTTNTDLALGYLLILLGAPLLLGATRGYPEHPLTPPCPDHLRSTESGKGTRPT
jgi:hypothetical protein